MNTTCPACEARVDCCSLACPKLHASLLGLARVSIPYRLQSQLQPEDLVQATLARACPAFEQLRRRTRAGLFAWLRTILRNVLRDELSRLGRMDKVVVSLEAIADRSDALVQIVTQRELPTPSSNLRGEERNMALMSAIGKLKKEHATAIQLRYFESMPLAEIATATGTTSKAVAMRVKRGVERLAVLLQGRDDLL